MRKIPIFFYGKTSIYWKNKASWKCTSGRHGPTSQDIASPFFSYPCLVKLSIHQASSNNTMVKWQKKKKTCFSFILKVCEAIWPAICTHVNCARTLHSRRTRGVENDARGTVADLFSWISSTNRYLRRNSSGKGLRVALCKSQTRWKHPLKFGLFGQFNGLMFHLKESCFWPSNVLFPKRIA